MCDPVEDEKKVSSSYHRDLPLVVVVFEHETSNVGGWPQACQTKNGEVQTKLCLPSLFLRRCWAHYTERKRDLLTKPEAHKTISTFLHPSRPPSLVSQRPRSPVSTKGSARVNIETEERRSQSCASCRCRKLAVPLLTPTSVRAVWWGGASVSVRTSDARSAEIALDEPFVGI